MFKEIFGFSFPGFETPEEAQKLREYEYDQAMKKLKEESKNEKEDKTKSDV